MAQNGSNDYLSQMVRRQLLELGLDPGGSPPARSVRLACMQWLHTKSWVPLVVIVPAMLGLFAIVYIVATVLAAAPPQAPRSVEPGSQTTQVRVSLADRSIELTQPSIQRYAAAQIMLLLHVELRNDTSSPAALLAGDLALVDVHGSVFPPVWHDTEGTIRDGIGEPQHTLVGLDPGGSAEIDLPFLAIGDGPFAVRYARGGTDANAGLPTLTLRTSQ